MLAYKSVADEKRVLNYLQELKVFLCLISFKNKGGKLRLVINYKILSGRIRQLKFLILAKQAVSVIIYSLTFLWRQLINRLMTSSPVIDSVTN